MENMVNSSTESLKTWEQAATNPREQEVLQALADPKWDLRTVGGISETTELSPATVKTILAKYSEYIRVVELPDRPGQRLFTLRERSPSWRERVVSFSTFVTKSIH